MDRFDRENFIKLVTKAADEAHDIAQSKGWWPANEKLTDMEVVRNNSGLMHSELSEALEASRHGNPPDDKIPEFNGATAEYADTIIRIFDVCSERGWPIAEAILAKMEFNRTRAHKHGGKVF